VHRGLGELLWLYEGTLCAKTYSVSREHQWTGGKEKHSSGASSLGKWLWVSETERFGVGRQAGHPVESAVRPASQFSQVLLSKASFFPFSAPTTFSVGCGRTRKGSWPERWTLAWHWLPHRIMFEGLGVRV
jgi:hypothetical protein